MSGVSAIIVAAGAGARFGKPKQFVYLRAKPVLEWTLERFQAHPGIGAVVLVLPDENDLKHYRLRYPKIVDIVRGGERRQDSVLEGLKQAPEGFDGIVLVHDAARPLVDVALVEAVAREAEGAGAALPVLPVVDTVKRVRDGLVVETLDRGELGAAQTPQGFRYALLVEAYEAAFRDRLTLTDEAMAVERLWAIPFAGFSSPRITASSGSSTSMMQVCR